MLSLPMCARSRRTFVLVVLLASSPAPAQGVVYQHRGSAAADFTRDIAGGGDFDGDGHADYLAAMSGGGRSQLVVYSGATAQPLRVHRNLSADDGLGTCLAVLGDIDSDGRPDYIAGAPADARNGAGAGAAYVFSGRTHQLLTSFVGAAPGDALGPCASLGDIDGDAVPDFAFAAPGHDFAGIDGGAVYVVSGRTLGVVRSHLGSVGQRLGELLAGGADADGDGVRDYLISANGALGRVFDLHSGRTGARLFTFVPPLAAAIARLVPAGDLDRDGRTDLLAIDPTAAGGVGNVFALSGATLTPLHQVAGVDACAYADDDRDGHADFVVTQPGAAPVQVQVYSGRTGATLRTIVLGTPPDRVALAGDVNRDGEPEVLLRMTSVSTLAVVSFRPVAFSAPGYTLDLLGGGTMAYTTSVPSAAGGTYLVLGSASGTNPGLTFAGVRIPLNPDGLFAHTLGNPNAPPYTASLGTLDATGRAVTRLQLPQGLPQELAGLTLQHAALVLTPTSIFATTAFPLTLLGRTPPTRALVENFATSANRDDLRSAAGTFGRFSLVGGSGVHGDFDHRLGVDRGNGVFEFDLQRDQRGGVLGFAVPATHTLSGREEFVTDGAFEFATLQIPAGITVRVLGSTAFRPRVRGKCRVDGVLDVSGAPVPMHLGFLAAGQPGGQPGPGGAPGGKGADASSGSGVTSDGAHGQDVQVAANHAYRGTAAGTGGRGSLQYPTSNALVTHNYSGVVCTQMAAGGGGGSSDGAGGSGQVLRTPNNVPGDQGPPALPGSTFQLFPLPNPLVSSVHFAVGGAGGGGGGSHIYSHTIGRTFTWRSGAAGAGGGGVLALRAGGAIEGSANGEIRARGGEGSQLYMHVSQGPPTPGGGGAGGSILLQTPATIAVAGGLDVGGGRGGFVAPGTGQPLLDISVRGGDGGSGFIRLESPSSIVGRAVPPLAARNIGPMLERDAQAGQQSAWYDTGLVFAPRYLRYEIEADVNGVATRFSDDPAFGTAAQFGNPAAAVWVKLQGAESVRGALVEGPWRDRAADLTQDRAQAVRFVIVANGASVVFRRLRVVFEE